MCHLWRAACGKVDECCLPRLGGTRLLRDARNLVCRTGLIEGYIGKFGTDLFPFSLCNLRFLCVSVVE
jgi:hypothetical protein